MGDKNATPVAVKRIGRWVRSRSVREQVTMGVVAAFVLLVLIKVFVKSQTYLFVATQVAHSAGILLLIYKLTITKTCSGVARFFSCANWINMLIDSRGELLTKIGQAQLYILVALIAEVVQTFILADFCYYYVKSVMAGERMMRLPSLV